MYKIIVATQYITVISVYLSSFMYKTILNKVTSSNSTSTVYHALRSFNIRLYTL